MRQVRNVAINVGSRCHCKDWVLAPEYCRDSTYSLPFAFLCKLKNKSKDPKSESIKHKA